VSKCRGRIKHKLGERIKAILQMFIRFTIFCNKGGREKRRPLRPYLQVIPSSVLELELVSFLYQESTSLRGTYETRLSGKIRMMALYLS
jgi:hypothetical protein